MSANQNRYGILSIAATGLVILLLNISMAIHANAVVAAEFRCEVRVDNVQVESGRSSIFDEMENDLVAFINEKNWTNLEVAEEEKIRCNLLLTITEWDRDANKFEAKLQVQAARPVFNSAYNTSIINHLDEDLEFEYASHLRIEYVQGSYLSELGTVVAFYMYFILGLDMDSFGENGGDPFFNEAMEVVNTAQTGGRPGWAAFDSERNRHGLVYHIRQERYRNFRQAWYIYHRKGLDLMAENSEKGREGLLDAMKKMREFHRRNPNAYLLRMFFRAKSSELINAFSQASAAERQEMLQLLQTMDPRNSSEYRRALR